MCARALGLGFRVNPYFILNLQGAFDTLKNSEQGGHLAVLSGLSEDLGPDTEETPPASPVNSDADASAGPAVGPPIVLAAVEVTTTVTEAASSEPSEPGKRSYTYAFIYM